MSDSSLTVAGVTSGAVVLVGILGVITARFGDRRADKARQDEQDQEARRRHEDRDNDARVRAEERTAAIDQASAQAVRDEAAAAAERRASYRAVLIRFVGAAEFCNLGLARFSNYGDLSDAVHPDDWRRLTDALGEVRLRATHDIDMAACRVVEALTTAAANDSPSERARDLAEAKDAIEELTHLATDGRT